MATLYDRLNAPGRTSTRIADLWWAMALRGVSAIALGSLAVLWPDITLLALAGIFAAYCVVDAVFSFVLARRRAKRAQRWGWLAFHGVVSVAAAVLTVLYPDLTVLAFVMLLTAWALVTGTLSIIGAFQAKAGEGRGWLILSGGVSLVLGLLLLLFPWVGLFTLTWMLAVAGWMGGAMLLSFAFALRMRQAERQEGGSRAESGPAAVPE